jgi:hypothetical protein
MPFQIIGETTGGISEIETNSKALRGVQYPVDPNLHGVFSAAATIVTGTQVVAGPMLTFQWLSATTLASLRKVIVNFNITTNLNSVAGTYVAKLFAARNFSVQHNANQTALLVQAHSNKHRTRMEYGAENANIVFVTLSNAAMTGAVYTLDANPMGAVAISALAGNAKDTFAPGVPIFAAEPGEHPYLMRRNEGFEVQWAVPTGINNSIGATVAFQWEELESY